MTKRDWLQSALIIIVSVIATQIILQLIHPYIRSDYHIYSHVDTTHVVPRDTLGILDLQLPYRGKHEDTMMVEIKLCKIRDTCQWFFKCFVMMPRDTGAVGAGDVKLGYVP